MFHQNSTFEKINLQNTDYRNLNFSQKNAFYYVGGYFLKKCLEKHSCEACQNYARANQDMSDQSIYTFFRAYENAAKDTFGNLKSPNDSFFQYLGSCENVFTANFKNLALQPNVGIQLKNKVFNVPLLHPCDEFPKEYFASLFVRTRIFYTIKFLNRDISLQRSSNGRKNEKLTILQHL